MELHNQNSVSTIVIKFSPFQLIPAESLAIFSSILVKYDMLLHLETQSITHGIIYCLFYIGTFVFSVLCKNWVQVICRCK